MSSLTLFNGAQVPAFARQTELSATAKALMGSGGGVDHVSIKGGVFRLVIGGKEIAKIEERYLDAVIVKAAPKVNRVWYAKKYDGENTAAPDCWSADGDTPSQEAAKPQATRCSDCEKNIAGSGEGTSRACRFQQRIAIVLAHGKEEDTLNHGDHGVLQLTVPAASLFGKAEEQNRPLQDYARFLAGNKTGPEMLVTRIKFDTDVEHPKLWFKPMRWLTPDEYAQVQEFAESPEAERAVEVSFGQPEAGGSEEVEALPGKRPTKVDAEDAVEKPKAKTKAKPAADDEDEKPAPKTKAKPAADDDEDEKPAPKAKAKPAPAADDDEDEKPAPKAKAKPAADDEDEDDAPTTRKGKAAPAAETKKSLADIANNWDD